MLFGHYWRTWTLSAASAAAAAAATAASTADTATAASSVLGRPGADEDAMATVAFAEVAAAASLAEDRWGPSSRWWAGQGLLQTLFYQLARAFRRC
jgi:hypothetical protein